jgi:hypothetical protein
MSRRLLGQLIAMGPPHSIHVQAEVLGDLLDGCSAFEFARDGLGRDAAHGRQAETYPKMVTLTPQVWHAMLLHLTIVGAGCEAKLEAGRRRPVRMRVVSAEGPSRTTSRRLTAGPAVRLTRP